jgi:hypothetical protein
MPAMESLLIRLKSEPESVKNPILALAQVSFLFIHSSYCLELIQ